MLAIPPSSILESRGTRERVKIKKLTIDPSLEEFEILVIGEISSRESVPESRDSGEEFQVIEITTVPSLDEVKIVPIGVASSHVSVLQGCVRLKLSSYKWNGEGSFHCSWHLLCLIHRWR